MYTKYKRAVVHSGYTQRTVYTLKPSKTFEELKDYIGEVFHLGYNDVSLYTDGRKSTPDLIIRKEDWDPTLSKRSFDKLALEREIKRKESYLKGLENSYKSIARQIEERIIELDSLKEKYKL